METHHNVELWTPGLIDLKLMGDGEILSVFLVSTLLYKFISVAITRENNNTIVLLGLAQGPNLAAQGCSASGLFFFF